MVNNPPAKLIRYSIFLLVFSFSFILDRLTKNLVMTRPIPDNWTIPTLLQVRKGFNPGVAFGLAQSTPAFNLLLASIITIVLLWYVVYRASGTATIALAFIVGGAIGNISDRLLFQGQVIDFLATPFIPTFNMADMAITVGGIWLILLLWIEHKKKK
ncbi:MAG: signal peptidase II [Nanoarchaeota archaeon]